MSKPDPYAQFRTRDAALNSARVLLPNASPEMIALAAALLHKGLLTFEEIGDYISRAAAIRR